MEDNNMKRGLKSRHISMIAIGGAIGTGLLLLQVVSFQAGPGGAILAYLLIESCFIFNVVYWRTCYILSCIWFV